MQTLHCLGCGRAAQVILRLLHEHGQFRIGQIANRSLASAEQAAAFIGAGQPSAIISPESKADGLLVGLPDGCLNQLPQQLPPAVAASGGEYAFALHLSASVKASVLEPLAAECAAVHPALAFAQPQQALRQFPGSWCVGEGSPGLLQKLEPVFHAIGARFIAVPALNKPLYHAAAMTASNAIIATLAMAQRLIGKAGMDQEQGAQLLLALAARNIAAADRDGLAAALTGPVERGDVVTLQRLRESLRQHAPDQLPAWLASQRLCVDLARNKGHLSDDQLAALAAVLLDEPAAS
ncbi:MAG: Rossmann-like and DUF2520 domain-containing protein [Wenzhouxiangellaceae bacterium]